MSQEDYNSHSMDATVARIETKLDTALNALTDQNRRLVALEIAENKRAGALATVGLISGAVCSGAAFLVQYLKGK
jgi:hypothetical protein